MSRFASSKKRASTCSQERSEPVAANVGIRRDGLDPDGKRFPLYSGRFHYWRHDPALWPGILDAIKTMGFQTSCTYIPPGACMSVRGETSTSGRTIPRWSDARVEAAFAEVDCARRGQVWPN